MNDTVTGTSFLCIRIVPGDKHGLYFERLRYHFANGNMDVVFSNRQMQYESFRMKIIALLKNNKQIPEVCSSSAPGPSSEALYNGD
jgi:hypothetical protein